MSLPLDEIEKRRRELLDELNELELLHAKVTASHAQGSSAERSEARSQRLHMEAPKAMGGRSLRDLVLDALDEIGFMVYAQQLTLYIKARFGRDINSTRFGTLSVDEEKSFRRGAVRTVRLGHGLTHDRAEPVKRLWARSDWPLSNRIVTPAFGRAQYLRATARFAALAMTADDLAVEPDRLRYMAADHARDLGVVVKHGEFALEQWRAIAEQQLSEIAERESQLISQCTTMQSGDLTPVELLFGRAGRPVLLATPSIGKQA